MGANENAARAERTAGLDDLRRKYLLMRCHKLAASRLAKLLTRTMASCEKSFDALAVREENNTIRTLYLDARREMQIKRTALESAFAYHLVNEFYRDIKSEGWSSLNTVLGIDEAPCELVKSDDLEEKIIIADLVSRANRRYADLLRMLIPQYGTLISEYEIKKDNQPLSPGRICTAFRKAVGVLDLCGPVMQVCYEQFEHQVLNGLGPLYIELSDRLGVEGVSSGRDEAPDGAARDTQTADASPALQEQQQGIRQAEVREQQARVRKIVDYEIASRIGKRQLPSEINTMLDGVWKDMLATIYLEEGFDSTRWEIALEITEDLLWSLEPKKSVTERRQLAEMIPGLLSSLRGSLEQISWGRIRIESLFRELSSYHIANLRGPAANDQPARKRKDSVPVRARTHEPDTEAGPGCAADASEEIVLDATMVSWTGDLDDDLARAEDFALARSMQVGEHVEFLETPVRLRCLRLEWKGSEIEDYIFVDVQSNASVTKSLESLALEFRKGVMRRTHAPAPEGGRGSVFSLLRPVK